MMRILSPRFACTTTSVRRRYDCPIVIRRSSVAEWRGSSMVRDNGSPNTVATSSKETPCFFRFPYALCSSHSKVRPISFLCFRPLHQAAAKLSHRASLVKSTSTQRERANEKAGSTRPSFLAFLVSYASRLVISWQVGFWGSLVTIQE